MGHPSPRPLCTLLMSLPSLPTLYLDCLYCLHPLSLLTHVLQEGINETLGQLLMVMEALDEKIGPMLEQVREAK